ncbi:hypothetical protein [Parathalassolituus penaei]|uniref:Uncharacterized protein n=1 Tax=Parathalassolituus penaei TaxID=2997323 RepID=A0A9X3ISI3_9GAMM|nr:hypothetical protein [Parathalassolituus penaei]MCY0965300.1 hypothetical protein [Parathalassolituus penaei]
MEVVTLVGLIVQLVTLGLLYTLMSRMKKQQPEIEAQQQQALEALFKRIDEQLENVAIDVKDHAEVAFGQLNRETESLQETLADVAESSGKALALQELAFSEATTGNTRIQDMLSDNSRRQQKLTQDLISSTEQTFRDTSAGVESSIRGLLEKHDKALVSLGESSQRMLSSVTAHFNNLGNDTAALKKAAAALLNHNKGVEEQLRSKLEGALEPIKAELQTANELSQAILDNSKHIEPLTESVYAQQRHLQVIRDNTSGLIEAHVSLQNHTERLQALQELTTAIQQHLEELGARQLTAADFEAQQHALSESLDDIAAIMQPLLSIDSMEPAGGVSLDGQALVADFESRYNSLLDDLNERYQTLLIQGQALEASLDAAQTTLYTELDSVRAAQVKANQQNQDLQRLLGLLRLQQTALMSAPATLARQLEDQNGQLRIETDDQVQYLSGYRLDAVENRHTGEFIRFSYGQDGRRLQAETLYNGQLRYRMQLNPQGGPLMASEFDHNGRELVQYQYDSAGNVTSKRELLYDASGMPVGSTDTSMVS